MGGGQTVQGGDKKLPIYMCACMYNGWGQKKLFEIFFHTLRFFLKLKVIKVIYCDTICLRVFCSKNYFKKKIETFAVWLRIMTKLYMNYAFLIIHWQNTLVRQFVSVKNATQTYHQLYTLKYLKLESQIFISIFLKT